MVRKILLISSLLLSVVGFSQKKTITRLKATPNPFKNTTVVSFKSSTNQSLFISVKNVLGKTIFNEELKAKKGKNSFSFDRNDLKSGMYIYTVQSTKEVISKRFVIK